MHKGPAGVCAVWAKPGGTRLKEADIGKEKKQAALVKAQKKLAEAQEADGRVSAQAKRMLEEAATEVEKAKAKVPRVGSYTGQVGPSQEPPWPAKAGEGAPPAKPPPARGTMSMEQLEEAVATFPHKQPSVARTRSPMVKTPPGGRSRGEAASSYSGGAMPSPAQAGKGSSTPAFGPDVRND